MSLSVLCVTGDAPARVAPILGLLRPVADEIVVVVPALDPDDACDAYGGAADRVVRAPADMPGTLLAWACSLCREDWIMPIGEDEVPSRALVDALPSLLARDDVLQYHIPRRSLYPVPGRWLDSHPWSSEYRIRVVRNDRATLRFAGPSSDSPQPVLPAQYLEEPIYYMGLLGHAVDGALETAPVPEADRPAIHLVLASAAKAPPAVEVDPVAESEASTLADGGYDAEIEPLRLRIAAPPGEELDVPVRVLNRGSVVWRWGDVEPRIRLSYRTSAGIEGPRTLFSADVHPGESTVVPLRFVAPSVPGRHEVEVDLVHEFVRWFGCEARFEVEVVAQESERPAVHAPAGIVCVTGMMRSGTSLVARVLNLLGVDFGPGVKEEEVSRAATLANEKGFWENGAIERLNNELLAGLGGSALAPPALADGWEQRPELKPFRDRAAQIIARELPGAGPIGWKDPVTSLTLPFWRTVTRITATVLCLRDPVEVARSLTALHGTDEETGARLWLAYMISACRADPARLVIRYDEFFDDHEAAARRIATFLGLPEPAPATLEDIGLFIEWRLRHHRVAAIGGRASSEWMALARSLYRVLATAPGEAGPLVDILHRQMLAAPEV